MRIVASACLVLAILFMVGCGTSAEDKKMIQEHATKIQTLEKKVGDMEKSAMDMAKKFADVETFLKGKFKDYGAPPADTMKKPEPPKGGKTPTPEPPKKEEPTKGKGPAKGKEPGKTK